MRPLELGAHDQGPSSDGATCVVRSDSGRCWYLHGAVGAGFCVGVLMLLASNWQPSGLQVLRRASPLGRAVEAFELPPAPPAARFEPLVARVEQTFKPIATRERGSFQAECRMGPSESCSVKAMKLGNITAVFPGGSARCIFGTSPEYLFQVIPGDTHKLIIHFDMGGACWDLTTASTGLCLSGVAEMPREGIFDMSNPKNPYFGYTVIVVGYCSGDAHVGAVIRDWIIPEAGDVVQGGYANALSVVQWAAANFGGRRLKSLLLTGSSAGALGVQIWARRLLRIFDYESAAVIADSFAGAFPLGMQGQQQKDVGLCVTGLLPDFLKLQCQAGTVEVQQVYEATMQEFPDVVFASIDSKVDQVQIAFYEVIFMSLLGRADYAVSPQIWTEKLAEIYRRFNLQPNWVSYMVSSANHMFLVRNILYQTRPGGTVPQLRTSGLVGDGLALAGVELTGHDTPLPEWLAALPVRPGAEARSACRGVGPPRPASPPALLGGLGIFGSLLRSEVGTFAQETAEITGVGHCDLGQSDKVFRRSPV